jgi:HlyD family secretion protein
MKNRNTVYLFLLLLAMASCEDKKEEYDASGSFEAIETIVSAEASGKILQLNIHEGQVLDSGVTIGYIDSTQLHLSKMQLVQSKKAILSGRPQTNIQIDALITEKENAVLDRDRTANLVKGGVASQKQLDDAEAKVTTLQSRINAQQSSLGITTSSINEQGGTVDAQMKEVSDQLRKCVIINQVKGTVLVKYAEAFEMAVLGKPLYKIADISTLDLRAYVTGDQLPQIKIGQHVGVYTDDGKGGYRQTDGVITWINDKSEFTPKTIQTKNERANLVYAIKANVKNEGFLKIGMYGELKFNKQ